MNKSVKLLSVALVGLTLAGCGGARQDHKASQSSSSTSSSQLPKTTRQMNNTHSKALRKNPNVVHSIQRAKSANKSNSSDRGAKKVNYSDKNAAQKKVGYHDKTSVEGLKPVDLGHGIKGYEDRGAGQIYLTFYMGNWSMEVHGNDVNSSSNATLNKAKSLVTYLQSHTLPIPQDKGNLLVEVSNNSAKLTWQKRTRVNRLNGNLNQVLQKAVTMK